MSLHGLQEWLKYAVFSVRSNAKLHLYFFSCLANHNYLQSSGVYTSPIPALDLRSIFSVKSSRWCVFQLQSHTTSVHEDGQYYTCYIYSIHVEYPVILHNGYFWKMPLTSSELSSYTCSPAWCTYVTHLLEAVAWKIFALHLNTIHIIESWNGLDWKTPLKII